MNDARIFISYSHRGDGPRWRAALFRALHVFEQHHLLAHFRDKQYPRNPSKTISPQAEKLIKSTKATTAA